MDAITPDSLLGTLDERPAEGVHRVDRRIFTDPELFELEMKYIFEGTWLYMAHESQIPNPHDFLTSQMGRQPVILNRDSEGKLRGFINACAHRGTTLVQTKRGNLPFFACPFHGWCFSSAGELVRVRAEKGGGYPDQFDYKNYGLTPVPRVESYRGFIFASLNDEVPALRDHLGDARSAIDLLCDQSPDGLEVLPGVQTYTYDGNWKLQAENGVDGYHVGTIHRNYVDTVKQRMAADRGDSVATVDVGNLDGLPGGYFDLGQGHTLLWNEWPNPQIRPLYSRQEALTAEFGEPRARWMTSYLRNLLLYPNVFLMDQMSTQIRAFRPIAVDRTEITTLCIAPVGEADEARRVRIRQYEDFFNASGMATPDDLAAFNSSQDGFQGRLARWNDMSRGAKHYVEGANEHAEELGVAPLGCGNKLEDEGIFIAQHRRWGELMAAGIEREARDGDRP